MRPVFVPMQRMPLNPNGKIDKPRLPFPDTVQANVGKAPANLDALTPTQKILSEIWAKLLPNAPTPIPLDENFFDIGGHSILATRLTFEVRKRFVIEAPLSLIFDQPTIKGLASAIDILRNDDLGFNSLDNLPPPADTTLRNDIDYAADYEALISSLQPSYAPAVPREGGSKITVFLTGSTGFLGSFILAQLLSLQVVGKVICLVRGKSEADAFERLRSSSEDRGVWQNTWVDQKRVSVVTGDLSAPKFGLQDSLWVTLCETVDAVVHNGALVCQFVIEKFA
jgi:L-2-aminoadipate reductase